MDELKPLILLILNGLILRYSLIPRFDITFLERNTLELVKN